MHYYLGLHICVTEWLLYRWKWCSNQEKIRCSRLGQVWADVLQLPIYVFANFNFVLLDAWLGSGVQIRQLVGQFCRWISPKLHIWFHSNVCYCALHPIQFRLDNNYCWLSQEHSHYLLGHDHRWWLQIQLAKLCGP